MTTRVKEDLSYEEFKHTLNGIREHNNRRMEAVLNGGVDPGSYTMPAWAGKRDKEDYSSLPQSTLTCFQENEQDHNKQLTVNKEVLQSVTDQRAEGDLSQDDYEQKLNRIKNENEAIRNKNDDDLYKKLLEEGKKHPGERKKILEASNDSGDFITGIWKTVADKIVEIVKSILETIGKWVVGLISQVVGFFKNLFHF